MNKILSIIVLGATFWTGCNIDLYSQSKNLVGVCPLYEYFDTDGDGSGRFGVGLQYERLLSQKFSVETGLFFRSIVSEWSGEAGEVWMDTKLRENYVWAPLLVKRNTSIVNISAGASVAKFIGWKDIGGARNLKVTDYKVSPEVTFALVGKLGKSFDLGDKLVFEPEISITRSLNAELFYYGLGLSVKYKL